MDAADDGGFASSFGAGEGLCTLFRAGRLEAVGGGGSFVGVGGNLIDAIYGVESSYLWLKSS